MKIDLYNGNCFNIFKRLPDNSVDMVCVDPPYGTTTIEWDTVLDFNEMWKEVHRIAKKDANIIVFGSQPFSSFVICSNYKNFKYELIWNKNKCGSPGLAKIRPQKVHENIMIFNRGKGKYNPIMEKGEAYIRSTDNPDGYGSGKNSHGYGFGNNKFYGSENKGTRYPKSILHASRNFSAQQTVHPTQKPTNLLNWLIMTYSDPDDVLMDFCMGSGSCGISAKETGRNFIGIEQDKDYFEIAKQRIEDASENIVGVDDHQLTTQISKEMQTLPQKKSQKNPLIEDLFE